MAASAPRIDLRLRQRAALRAALRSGDPIAIARAWEKLRVDTQGIARHERRAAREARLAVGRAIRDARQRRLDAASRGLAAEVGVEVAPQRRPSRRSLLVALLAGMLLILLLLIPREEPGGGGSEAAPLTVDSVTAPVVQVVTGGRGRTSATAAPFAAAEIVVPSEQPTPTAIPTATPGRSASPSGVPGGTGTGSGGSGGGTGGGSGTGIGTGTGSGTGSGAVPTAKPTAAPTPRPLPAGTPPPTASGKFRFWYLVTDQGTGLPVAGVCVSMGTIGCSSTDFLTNELGYWWSPELNVGDATNWPLTFAKDGYITSRLTAKYVGQTTSSNPGRVFFRQQ